MAPATNQQHQIASVAVIGNYLFRRCGIATFTADLVEGLSEQAPDSFIWAAAMNDRPGGTPTRERCVLRLTRIS